MKSRRCWEAVCIGILSLSSASCVSGHQLEAGGTYLEIVYGDSGLNLRVASCGPKAQKVAVLRVDDQNIDEIRVANMKLESGLDPEWDSPWSIGELDGNGGDGVLNPIISWSSPVDAAFIDGAQEVIVTLVRQEVGSVSYSRSYVSVVVPVNAFDGRHAYIDEFGDYVEPGPDGRFECT